MCFYSLFIMYKYVFFPLDVNAIFYFLVYIFYLFSMGYFPVDMGVKSKGFRKGSILSKTHCESSFVFVLLYQMGSSSISYFFSFNANISRANGPNVNFTRHDCLFHTHETKKNLYLRQSREELT